MTRIVPLGLCLLAVLLCGLITIEVTSGTIKERALQLSVQRLPQGPANAASGESEQVEAWTAAILARPLFEPSRRPPMTAAAGGATAAFPRLAGIIITPQSREAIFSAPGSARPIVVTAGSRLNGVLIKAIDDDKVLVVDASGQRIIRPSFDLKGPQPSASEAMPAVVELPPVPSGGQPPPFAWIRGLTGRPLGLAANPDPPPPPTRGLPDALPSPPALAPTGGSP